MSARKTTRPTARPKVASKAQARSTARAKSGEAVRIYSWNVNGIRSAVSRGLVDWLARTRAEIVGLQEVRAGGRSQESIRGRGSRFHHKATRRGRRPAESSRRLLV